MPGFLVSLLIVLILVGLLLYIAKLLPIDPVVKQIMTAIVVVFIAIWLIYALAGGSGLLHFPCR